METLPVPTLLSDEVQIKMLAAPIHPSDVTTIEGRYGVRPGLPAIGGSEGCGVVTKIGLGVTSVKVGDVVVAIGPEFGGTWRTIATAKERSVLALPQANDSDAALLALAAINPVTAQRLLTKFAKLSPGDVIIQNCGASSLGLFVSQTAKKMGLKTISIIRRTPNFAEQHSRCLGYGAFLAVGEDFFSTVDFKALIKDLPAPKLALDGIGGKASEELSRHLAQGGTLVSFSAQGKSGVSLPASSLIFKGVNAKGFWLVNDARDDLDGYKESVKEAARWLTTRDPKVALPPAGLGDFLYRKHVGSNGGASEAQEAEGVAAGQVPNELRVWAETRSFKHFWNDAWASYKDPSNSRKVVMMMQQ